ncbi:MAG: major tail protein [Eubacteriales bacterium]
MVKPLPRIGVDKLYYAPIVTDGDNGAAYANPVHMPGVTDIGYKPNSKQVTFAADDGIYASVATEGEIEVEISVADILAKDYAYLLGSQIAANGVVTEGNGDIPKEVALGYRSMKSDGSYRYEWILKGTFQKPNQTSKTKGQGVDPQSKTIKFAALNRVCDGKTRRWYDSDNESAPIGLSDAMLADETTGWFSSPDYAPTAPGTAIDDLVAVTGSDTGEIDITFSAAAGAESVKVQIADGAIGAWTDAETAGEMTPASTSGTIQNLTAGNTYQVRLVVLGGDKNGVSNTDSAQAGA